tara:strand:- start:1 stop:258 length:258 start_codon:yes stop_codon:yes gene_type:complete
MIKKKKKLDKKPFYGEQGSKGYFNPSLTGKDFAESGDRTEGKAAINAQIKQNKQNIELLKKLRNTLLKPKKPKKVSPGGGRSRRP